MKVAILMSTYNGEKYLREQIESLQKQTFKKWELFIRDDGSTDNKISVINLLFFCGTNPQLCTSIKFLNY